MGPHHCPAILQTFFSCPLFHNSYLSSRFLLYPTALPHSQEKEYLLTSSWKPPLLSIFSPSNTFFLATYPLIPKELPLKRRVSLRLLWFPSHPIFPQGPPSLTSPSLQYLQPLPIFHNNLHILNSQPLLLLFINNPLSCLNKLPFWDFLVVQWLRLRASTARGKGSIPGLGTKTLNTVWYDPKKSSL